MPRNHGWHGWAWRRRGTATPPYMDWEAFGKRPRSGEIPRHGHDAHATSENLEMRPLKTEEHDSDGGRKETSARLAAWNGYSQMRWDRM
jgi:hypothetical protein